MITLSNGHHFEYTAASGALAYDGCGWPWESPLRWFGLLDPPLFTAVTKTLTPQPRAGNLRWYAPFRCIRFLARGTVNAVGLSNPGIEWWCRAIGPTVSRKKVPLVVSLFSENIGKLSGMAAMLNDFDIAGIEFNASCPNTSEGARQNARWVIDASRAIRARSTHPLTLKLSFLHDVKEIVSGVRGAVEALSINSVPWPIVFPHEKSPLAHLGGGAVSGGIAQPFTWGLLLRLMDLTDIPVIGPSVWDFRDIETVRRLGARAVSFGSIFLRYPWRPTLFIRKDRLRRNMPQY